MRPDEGPSPKLTSSEQLLQAWQNASWLKVIEVFGLDEDDNRRSKADEIWIRSPFMQEKKASLHLNSSMNVYKDFSSGEKRGDIGKFCQKMNMFQVGQWMLDEGISRLSPETLAGGGEHRDARVDPELEGSAQANQPIKIDLRPYLQLDHPEFARRGISPATCRYLECGFLPPRPGGGSSPLNGRLTCREILKKTYIVVEVSVSCGLRFLALFRSSPMGEVRL
jgi:hypothetical protein